MPWLTPGSIPETYDCRSLSIPASSEWLALVSGALTELTLKWNWTQFGSVTVEETIAVMQAMIEGYYDGCSACTTQPGGARLIRIGSDGHLEQVGDDGAWETATGDYSYPPIPTREGGTPSDQICLAATNAENVLHQIYEQIADYFASELTPAEALTALVAWLITTFSIAAGTIVFALGAFILPVFALVWGALSYLTVDLWNGDFTSAFICTLIGCAENADGVVTWDWDCIEHDLYAAAVTFDISEVQLRLYAQINYLIWVLGGVDALNTMGATTGITEATCDFCADPCNQDWDFSITDGGWCDYDGASGMFCTEQRGEWVSGIGWVGMEQSGFALLYLAKACEAGVVEAGDVGFDYILPYSVTCQIQILRQDDLSVVDVILAPHSLGAGSGSESSASGSTYGYPVWILIRLELEAEESEFPIITSAFVHAH